LRNIALHPEIGSLLPRLSPLHNPFGPALAPQAEHHEEHEEHEEQPMAHGVGGGWAAVEESSTDEESSSESDSSVDPVVETVVSALTHAHLDAYYCEDCLVSFKYQSLYNAHKESQKHKNRADGKWRHNSYVCELCHYGTSSGGGMTYHLKSKGHKERAGEEYQAPITCPFTACNYSTWNASAYANHCETQRHIKIKEAAEARRAQEEAVVRRAQEEAAALERAG